MSGQGAGWDGEYAELGAVTNFSFLEGASHPAELMHQAKSLGLAAVGVADRNTLAGMVRALMGAGGRGRSVAVRPVARVGALGRGGALPQQLSPPAR